MHEKKLTFKWNFWVDNAINTQQNKIKRNHWGNEKFLQDYRFIFRMTIEISQKSGTS